MKQRSSEKVKPVILALLVVCITVAYPIFRQGIMCNDEVYLRLAGQYGLGNFFSEVIGKENLANGRVLGVLGNLKFLTYISDNIYVFRTIELIVLFSGMALYGYLIYRLLGSKTLGVATACAALVMLPVTFELAVPNSFMIVTVQPLIILMLSIIVFLNYLEKRRKRDLILYNLLYLWAMCLYEFIITYVFIYFLIHFIKRMGEKNTREKWFELIRDEVPPVVTAVVYLVLYVMQGILLPSQYAGNQLGISSIGSVFQIMGMLFVSALPGYYTFANEKYKWLFLQYKNDPWMDLILDPRIILVFLGVAYVLFGLWKLSNHKQAATKASKSAAILFTTVLYAFLPSMPNGVAKGYQGAVTPDNLSSLPVSLYLYLSIMFGLSYCAWRILSRIKQKGIVLVLVCAVAAFGAAIQITNGVIAEEEYRNYIRFAEMENVLSSQYMQNYNGKTFAAPSFYEVRNMLAIEEGHWSKYAQIYYDINVENVQDNLDEYEYRLTMQDNDDVLLETPDGQYLLSRGAEGVQMLQKADGTMVLMNVGQQIWKEKTLNVYELAFYM